jgi:hypothetical protein
MDSERSSRTRGMRNRSTTEERRQRSLDIQRHGARRCKEGREEAALLFALPYMLKGKTVNSW